MCAYSLAIDSATALIGSRANNCQSFIRHGSGACVTESMSALTDPATYGLFNSELTNCPRTAAVLGEKTTSPICLDQKQSRSKIVCLDSENCFGSTLNGANKCLGFCETWKQVSFQIVSGVIVEHTCLLNLDFGEDDEHS